MPIHEFKCKECETVFEKLITIDERHEPQACPDCRGETEKLISAPTVWSPTRNQGA